MEPLEFKKRPGSALPVRFFALGLVGLLALAIGLAVAPGAWRFPPGPGGILLLHLATLGWVTAVMMGADYQLVPVVLHRPIRGERLGAAIFWVYAAGVLVFLLGWGLHHTFWIAAGGALAGVGLLGFCGHMAHALASARGRVGPTAAGLGGGIAFLIVTAVLGPWMALGVGGAAPAPVGTILPLHAAAGLAGWLLLTILGATYQLVPFFAATEPGVHPRFGIWAVVLVGVGAVLLLVAGLAPAVPAAVGAIAVWAGLCLWLYDVVRMSRHGRMARREPVIRHTALAAGAIWLAAGGAAVDLTTGQPHLAAAAAYLGVVVGPSLLIMGQLQKILPFIAALDVSLAAKRRGQVPKTEALFPRERAFQILWVLGAGYIVAVGGLALGWGAAVRAGAVLAALAAIAYAVQMRGALAAWRRARSD